MFSPVNLGHDIKGLHNLLLQFGRHINIHFSCGHSENEINQKERKCP